MGGKRNKKVVRKKRVVKFERFFYPDDASHEMADESLRPPRFLRLDLAVNKHSSAVVLGPCCLHIEITLGHRRKVL